ncbi:MAG: hypothetical protein C0598_10430 [Marinilabiliales bacterium]|nr:MAG: hypothetical protein C0598_10430 [Marinilabiliales bacterium]
MKSYFIFLLSLVFMLSVCDMKAQKIIGDTITKTNPDSTIIKKENNSNAVEEIQQEYYEPSDDEIQEFGIITEIEDSAYPVFNITVEFPERQLQAGFYLNIEAINLQMDELYELLDKYATIFYTSDEDNDLTDMKLDGISLFGEYAPEEDYSSDNITGILSGAESVTMSDLPGKIYITDENNRIFEFEWYVDEMMVKANGKKVTAYYYSTYRNSITHIIPSEQ